MFSAMIQVQLAKMKLQDLSRYANEMENTNMFRVEEIERLREEKDTNGADGNEGNWEPYIDELNEYGIVFPSLLRYSVVLSTYSIIEETIVEIVKSHMTNSFRPDVIQKLNKDFRHKINSYGNKNDSLIIKLEKYMRKEMNTNSSFNLKTWKFIKELKTIRNNIAHNNGRIYVDQHPKRVVTAMESLGLLPHPSDETLDEKIAREIRITREFIPYMINQVECFFAALLKEIEQVN
ncbi:hypothetical protein CN556_24875 [Bacillus wiedmannii]|uniref:hypothetical protein n=1 Tax=Bacillus wiedmannii TaxID=1890302 RepID=UPI000BEBEE07|nr:hypothetical protein [Bacillus wiedmannii]PEC58441.1 hypothetical protein CON91_27935 [Bacillus wiedmannii]PEI34212.1 hypothetical protein CN644_18355 [Bacillus wiedmannii]PEN91889.1 hypothetical protein CN556_24875 [Bacillus wiedmannii]